MKRSMRLFLRASTTAALTAFLAACGATPPAPSTTKGLAGDGNGHNAAVIVGAPHNLDGVPTDIREFGNLLRNQDFDFRFGDVRANGDASVEEILDLTKEAAAQADSMIWFFSGHGNTGVLLASDRTFTFHEVAAAIREARDNRPLKRLLVFIDSCYSGSFVDGREPIIERNEAGLPICKHPPVSESTGAEQSFVDSFSTLDRGIFDEAFVLASSTRNESSVDLGAERGGAFTWSLRQVMADFKRTRDAATIGDFARETSRRTNQIGGHTPVYKAFPSERVLGEKIFHYDQ